MIVQGKVKTGLGDAKFWVNKISKVFYDKTNINLFPGTLNIELENEYELKNYWVIKKEEYGGTQDVYIQECEILDNKAYIVRSSGTIHKFNTLEIISNINFRNTYNLKDNDIVYINF